MSEETIIWSREELQKYIETHLALKEVEEPLKITIKDYKPRRTIQQNSLYWMWMDYLALFLNKTKGAKQKYTKDDVDTVCRHLHLGYEDVKFNRTVIERQLKRLSKLDKGEMFDYMQHIDEWAATSLKTQLPRPEKNEFDALKQQNDKGE